MTDIRRMLGVGQLDIIPFAASFTLGPDNNEQVIQSTGGSITLTLPRDLPKGFACLIEQRGAGAVIFSAATGATLANLNDHDRTGGQDALMALYVRDNVDGRSAAYLLTGDGAAA